MLFGKARAEILLNGNWYILEFNTMVIFYLDDPLEVGNTSW
jgi:hypothetical protein